MKTIGRNEQMPCVVCRKLYRVNPQLYKSAFNASQSLSQCNNALGFTHTYFY